VGLCQNGAVFFELHIYIYVYDGNYGSDLIWISYLGLELKFCASPCGRPPLADSHHDSRQPQRLACYCSL